MVAIARGLPSDKKGVEALKKILRLGLQDQALRIKLQSGAPVEFQTEQGTKQVTADTAIDAAYLQKIYAFLFPADKAALAALQTTKGVLNIPNVGKILLIAQPQAPASLRLYPPNGQALFDSDWTKLASRTIAPEQNPLTTASPLAMPVAAQPAPAPMAKTKASFGIGGFIPAGLAGHATDAAVAASDLRNSQPPPRTTAAPVVAPQFGMAPVAPVIAPQPIAAMPAFPDPIPAFQPIAIDYGGGGAPSAPVSIEFGPSGLDGGDISEGTNAIDPILTNMVKRKASDLHATCGEPLCMRVDGDIVRINNEVTTPEQMEEYLLPIMPARNRKEFSEISDTDFAYEIRGVGRFRVNIFRDKNGVGTVMRHIPSTILTAEQLNLPPAITKFCNLSKGLVLVTGPTGSGKSTTLAAMVDLINKNRSDHILSIEDPIEFVHTQQKCLVNQREVHKHTGSFARALRAALREDPDIVLIGEMRDLETVAIAIETAETGHLVFGTLHTTTAVSTIDRIVDQFPTDRQEQIRMMLSSSLKGVVAQTLLKKKAGGRVAAHEILVTNDAVSAMVREGKNHMIPNHMQSQKADGNILLNESLFKLVKDNVVDVEEAMRKSIDKTTFTEMLKRANIKTTSDGAAPAKPSVPNKQSA